MENMMLKVKVIGSGAAGNKATIALLNNKTIRQEDAVLINSTARDIPSEYSGEFINLSESYDDGGSAKEPKVGEQLTFKALRSGTLKLEDIITPDTDLVIFIAGTEGGTGCGSVPPMAKYVRDHLGFKVHIIAIKGFNADARGMDNTLSFFRKLQDNYAIECIDNAKFLQDTANGSFIEAEKLANDEIVSRVAVLMGLGIRPSEQNIDEKELKKIATREGYVDIEYSEIPDDIRIKNIAQFNDIIKNIIDSAKCLDVNTPSQTCMGIIINLPKQEQKYIDFKFPDIFNTYGHPFEVYTHVQDITNMPKFISFICTGMKMPIDEIKTIMESFKREIQNVDTTKDIFFDQMKAQDTSFSDMFNMESLEPKNTTEKDKSSFLDKFESSFSSESAKPDPKEIF